MHSKLVRNFSYLVLLVVLSVTGFLIFKDLNWVLGDDDLFLRTTMVGKPTRAWVGYGRFFPLSSCDYSILLLLPKCIGQTIEAHFGFNLIVLSMSTFLLYHLFNKVNQKNYGLSLFFVLAVFCISSFMRLHMSCVQTERQLFALQLLFIYFWWRGYERQSIAYYLVAWLFCSCFIFSKETSFGAILVIAIFNLILGRNQLTSKDKWFQWGCIVSALTYLSIYIYRLLYKHTTDGYYVSGNLFSRGWDAFKIIGNLFIDEPILMLIFSFAVVRGYYVLVKGDRRTVFADGLLLGGIALVCAYIVLTLTQTYYMFPAIIFSMPAMVYWTSYLCNRSKVKGMLIILLFVVSSVISLRSEKSYVLHTYDLRNNDMKVVEFIADSCIKGKYVYFFTNDQPMQRFQVNAIHGNVWEFIIYTHFINYVLQTKDYLREKNILRPVEKLEYVFNDSLVLCPVKMDQKYKDQLKNMGFKVQHSAFNIDVYGK